MFDEIVKPSKKERPIQNDEDRTKRIRMMFVQTWDMCAGDWLEMFPRQRCKGTAVQECVADADRFDMAGDKEAAAAWRAMPRPEQDAMLNEIFPPTKTFGY